MYTAQFDQALATNVGSAFTQKYPGVQVNLDPDGYYHVNAAGLVALIYTRTR